jgi:hypothetical protein
MGLDIYVRWGERDTDGADWTTFPKERREEQLTGFTSAPYAGYLRESWGSLAWTSKYAKEIQAPEPYGFYPEWEGDNGGELRCDENGLLRVLHYRDTVLRPWLRNRKARDAFYDDLRVTHEQIKEQMRPQFVAAQSRDEKMVLMDQLQAQWDGLRKPYEAFRGCITDVIGFLNFVELHKDEPNLTICFY